MFTNFVWSYLKNQRSIREYSLVYWLTPFSYIGFVLYSPSSAFYYFSDSLPIFADIPFS